MTVFVALVLEFLAGDPQNKHHPVAWFGHWAASIEKQFYQPTVFAGIKAWLIAIGIPMLATTFLYLMFGWLFSVVALWLCLGWKSLFEHVEAVIKAKTVKEAREALLWIVSRDVKAMKREDTRRAALESLAENASDAVVAPLFWFVVLGPLGVIFYRMVNTLDAMWGYRNERYQYFGWCAARIDDMMNWIPARLTAWLMLRVGKSTPWRMVKMQATTHASPNAGWPEVALAYAAHIRLGGSVKREGKLDERPWYGAEDARDMDSMAAFEAMQVVKHTLIIASILAVVVSSVF